METYGKRAVELRKFALQSDAPKPPESDVELMLSAQESLAAENEETTTPEELLNESLQSLGLSPDVIEFDPRETLDDVFNRIDNDLYLMYYAILEQIVNKCVDYAISEEIDYGESRRKPRALALSLTHKFAASQTVGSGTLATDLGSTQTRGDRFSAQIPAMGMSGYG